MFNIDDLFEKLGYFKVIDGDYIFYKKFLGNEFHVCIEFDLVDKSVAKYIDDFDTCYREITFEEFIAIFLKYKELGWLKNI